MVFLDDILIFSKTWDEHLDHIRVVLPTLRDHKLFCKPAKCMFGVTENLYLGHILTGMSISPDPKKLEAVESWPTPQTVTQVRSFLGFTNYFRRFIQGYADLASLLDEIIGKGAHFLWNGQRQAAFEQLKKALLQAPVLQLADVSRPFRVYTDASDTSIAAVLMQSKDDNLHPVAYVSRKLTSGPPTKETILLPNESHLPWYLL